MPSQQRNIVGRRAIIALLLSLWSCSSDSHWQLDETVTAHPRHNSGRLSLPIDDTYAQMGLEFCRGTFGLRLYANAQGRPFPPLAGDDTKTDITLTIDDNTYASEAQRFEGGQRLLLGEELTSRLTQALLANQSCSLSAGSYTTDVVAANFRDGFHKLNKIPITALTSAQQ